MRRLVYAFLVSLIAAAAFFAPEAAAFIRKPNNPAPLTLAVERVAYSAPTTDAATVLIQRPDSKGTGFHIGNGTIVTAAHVVAGAKTVSLKTIDGRITSASVDLVDEKADVAFLHTKARMLAADLDCRTAKVGEPIVAIGNPLGLEFVTAFGKIAGEPREYMFRSLYVTDITTVMGQSGGPVFANGKVIGVTSAVMVAPMRLAPDKYVPSLVGFGFVVPSTVVCEMLPRVNGGEE